MSHGQFRRVVASDRRPLGCTLDGEPVTALEGDTVLTMILAQRRHVRHFEFGSERRAGFCLMGACQDCWVRTGDGRNLRACTTLVEAGMQIVTLPGH